MMIKLNNTFIFRVEYFGGVLIDRNSFVRYELNKAETLFICALKYINSDFETIQSIVRELLCSQVDINIDKFLKAKIITDVGKNEECSEVNHIEIKKLITEECYRIFDGQKDVLSAPMEITIYPTLNCNLNCKFCFLKNKNMECNELSVEEWVDIIVGAKSKGVVSISILGGEPTQYSDIDKLLCEINKIGINTTITTNGVGLKETTKQILIQAQNIIPIVSIQALNDKNVELMGVDYKSILSTCEELVEKNKEIRLNSVYTNQRFEDFIEIIDYCIAKGIKRYSIATYVATNEENRDVIAHDYEEIRKLDEFLNGYIQNYYPNTKHFECSVEGCMIYSAYPELEDELVHMTEFEKMYYGCRAGKSKVEIYADGRVLPCICFENEKNNTSNVRKTNLYDIWYNDKFLNLIRRSKGKSEKCLKCGFNIFCNGGCPEKRYRIYGDKFEKYADPDCKMN